MSGRDARATQAGAGGIAAKKISRERTARFALLAAIPNLLAVVFAVLLSNSISLVADLLLSLLDFATVLVVWWVAYLALQSRGARLEFGFGKVESLTSAAVGGFMVVSLFVVVALALGRMQGGETELQGSGVIIGILANAVSGAVNLWLLLRYWRQARSDESPVVRSQIVLFIDKLTSNVVMLVALAGALLFSGTAVGPYIDPVASLIIALSMGFWALQILRRALSELLDAACGEEVQMPVTQALAQHFDDYDGIGPLRTRRAGADVFIEIELEFRPERTMAEVERVRSALTAQIRQAVPNARVTLLPRLAGATTEF